MTDKIYEYKDRTDWFVGKWRDLTNIYNLGGEKDFFQIEQELAGLISGKQGFDVSVLRYSSDFRLMAFIIDMINEELDRNLEIKPYRGAIIITEGQLLRLVHLPEQGLSLDSFFSQETKQSLGDKILIATRNDGKTKEFRQMFKNLGLEVENLNDHPDLPEVEETGTTFEENARLKAETIAQLTGQMVLADDSGLKVDALGGLPGVWSARFSGPDANDEKNNAKLLHELAMVFEEKDRSAQFHTTLVVAAPERESLVVEADWPGYIAFEAKGENGFGYDPLFLVGETGRTAAQLAAEEKNAQSHRGLAVKKLMEVFPAWQQKQS
ncbi:nucleoside-triphosphate diphosphatase [Streptococcus tangpeifui]|uniref:nucleoside-triphosphate diphosphatase n=1 Tax=Streptococcus tangpeifui TaxID=2709400 RepID=UPI0013EB95FA|nr:nucleoside-triphosphate diphosphatase [Streptococcus sp. ZJ373]